MRALAILPIIAASTLSAQQMSGMPDMDLSAPPPPHVTVRVDSAAGVVVVTTGPFRASSMAHGMGHEMELGNTLRFVWPVRGYLRGFGFSIHDSTGRAMPTDYLHHAHLVNLGRRELLVPMFQRIFAVGRETMPVELPASVGVPIPEGDSLALVVMLHSPTGDTMDGLYLTLRLPYTPEGHRNMLAVWPMHFESSFIAGESNAFDLPPGRSVRKAEFTMPVNGRLLAVGGHLHDYGRELRLVDCKSGKVIVLLKGRRDAAGHLLSVERFIYGFNEDALPLERGRRYRIEVEYDNPTGRVLVDGGMGSLGGPLVVEDPRDWPVLDPSDPQIIRDGDNL
jgi:hypothetical protein